MTMTSVHDYDYGYNLDHLQDIELSNDDDGDDSDDDGDDEYDGGHNDLEGS